MILLNSSPEPMYIDKGNRNFVGITHSGLFYINKKIHKASVYKVCIV